MWCFYKIEAESYIFMPLTPIYAGLNYSQMQILGTAFKFPPLLTKECSGEMKYNWNSLAFPLPFPHPQHP
jgi:hypothetical protein